MHINEEGAARAVAASRAQWRALVLCLALLLTARAGRAQVLSASASPTALPADGGNVTIQIVVSNSVAVGSVAAYSNAGYIGGLNAAGKDGNGNNIYSNVFAVGANATNLPRSFAYTVKVTDTANNVYNGSAGTVDQASPKAIKIISSSLSVSSLPAAGGSVTVSAVASVQAPNTINNLYVYANGAGLGYLTYLSTNGDGSLNYSGSFTLGQNVSDAPHPYQLVINGADNAGNRAAAIVGAVTVSNATPASVVSSTLSTNSLPASGGPVTINAVVSAPAPNDVSDVYAYRFSTGLGNLSYISTNADKTKKYTGTFTFPANPTDTPILHQVVMRLRDNANNAITVPLGVVTVGAATPIKILSATASASSQTAAGGSINVTATVLAPAPNDVSDLYVFNYTQGLVGLSYQSTNADGSKIYSGAFTNPTNATNATLVKDLLLRARDNAGNLVVQPIGTLAIAPQTPIKIVSATMTPNNITAAGGTVTITATALAPAPNDVQYIRAYRYDQYVGALSYQSTNADGSKVFSGAFTVPANNSNATLTYPYTLYAADNSNNYASQSLGSITVPAVTPIKILSATLSGNSVPAAGGGLVATVTVLAPTPNDVQFVRVFEYNAYIGGLTYASTNADGSKVYSGTVNLPAQRGSFAETDLISVQAADNLNNYAYTFLPNVTVGTAATTNPVTISSVSISTNSLPVTGGSVIVKATVKPAVAGTISNVQIYDYEFYLGTLIYQSSNADGSLNYSGSFNIPANTLPYATQNGFQVVTTLNNGDYSESIAPAGTLSAAPVKPLAIVSAALSTNNLPVTGGDIIISAVVSAPAGNSVQSNQNFYAYRNGGYIGRLSYQTTNADGTQNWSGSFGIGANTSGVALSDIYTILAVDGVGSYLPATAGRVTVATAGTLTINSALLSATSFPATGGEMVIMAKVTPVTPYAISNVYAYSNVNGLGYLTYLGSNADGSQNWIGAFPVAPNGNDAPRADYYYISSQDSLGNYVPYALGYATLAPLTSLSAVSAALSAASFPAAGGDLILTAKVNIPPTAVSPAVNFYSNGVYLGQLARQSANADGTVNYSVSYRVPGNVSDQPRSDYFYGVAYDNASNYANIAFGNITVGPATPVSITQAALSTSSLSVTGGDVIVTATTQAPLPNDVNGFTVFSNGQNVGGLTYQNTNPDGTKNYSGSFHIPANTGATLQSYIYTLAASDTAGNLALGVLGAISVDTIPATVAGKISLEGLVGTAAPQTLTFQFRPKDGSATFNLTASVKPDGFFNLLNIPRKDYDLWIKGPKNLAKVVGVNTLNSDAHSVTALLAGGDSNNDNSVDATDFGALVGSYGSDANVPHGGYDYTADFNGDGLVDTTDFGILVGNYGSVGDY